MISSDPVKQKYDLQETKPNRAASKIPVNPRLSKSRSSSLDWDSDSAKTGTVKRRPTSSEYDYGDGERDKTKQFSWEKEKVVYPRNYQSDSSRDVGHYRISVFGESSNYFGLSKVGVSGEGSCNIIKKDLENKEEFIDAGSLCKKRNEAQPLYQEKKKVIYPRNYQSDSSKDEGHYRKFVFGESSKLFGLTKGTESVEARSKNIIKKDAEKKEKVIYPRIYQTSSSRDIGHYRKSVFEETESGTKGTASGEARSNNIIKKDADKKHEFQSIYVANKNQTSKPCEVNKTSKKSTKNLGHSFLTARHLQSSTESECGKFENNDPANPADVSQLNASEKHCETRNKNSEYIERGFRGESCWFDKNGLLKKEDSLDRPAKESLKFDKDELDSAVLCQKNLEYLNVCNDRRTNLCDNYISDKSTSSKLLHKTKTSSRTSDSDSGIHSPLSPGSVYGVFYPRVGFVVYSERFKECEKFETPSSKGGLDNFDCTYENKTDTIQIYTDWANHYLEKARSKKRVSSLATDCSDGVLLAEVIESVTSQKIPDINRKPKSPNQMLDNINLCLATLHGQHIQGIEGISAQELRDGKLKAILALFFALSRHKQATKARQQQEMTPNRSTAIPHKGGTTTSSIPLPGSALPARRCPPDKVRPVAGSSRATSPALSMIPRAPPASQIASPYQTSPGGGKTVVTQNGSMLDKLKLFKNNEKSSGGTNGKRTSSSSGVSSAKSERSDSSVSLEANLDSRPVKNVSRIKQATKVPTTKTPPQKNSPNPAKKDGLKPQLMQNGGPKMVVEVEKHANKIAAIPSSKIAEPKIRVSAIKEVKSLAHQVAGNGTGIPKPTLAVKGTTKPLPPTTNNFSHAQKQPISREASQHSLTNQKPAVAMVSPMKNEQVKEALSKEALNLSNHSLKDGQNNATPKDQAVKETQVSESNNSASTGHQSHSSDSSVICKPSSENSCLENVNNPIPNRKEPLTYLSDVTSPPPNQIHHHLETLNETPEVSTEDSLDQSKPTCPKSPPPPSNDSPRLTTIPNHIRQTISKVENNHISLDKDQNISMKHIKEHSLSCFNANPKDDHTTLLSFGEDFNLNHQNHNGLISHTISDNFNVTVNGKDTGNADNVHIEPMRPLLRGYCNTLTLPGRQRGQYNRVPADGDYCEIALANGYLSEGELLRGSPSDISSDGYLSEGGAVLYARRLQNMPTHQVPNGSGLTVLTEQSTRRGGSSQDSPPPPPAPRGSSKSQRNGAVPQGPESKHVNTNGHHWKRYGDSPGVGSPPPPAPGSPTSNRRERGERRSSPHGKEKSSGSKGVRGGPQSFGYVKRNGTTNGGSANTNGTVPPNQPINHNGKTAAISAVPRTKVKVSGGTQTCSSDLQQSHKPSPSPPQFKSYSLTGNTANQLSQSVRERLMMGSQSLPKGGVHQEYGLVMRQMRPKASDGSLSDTQAIENCSPYAPWLRHSNTYSVAPRLSETDSMESLTSLPGHRSSLTHARLLRDSPSRLSRSNSIRSTKSEKLYPSMLHRNTEPETEPYYCLPIGSLSHWSQPTSPAPNNARSFPLSPTHGGGGGTPRHSIPKNDDLHGSSISLVSTASSLYSSAEEKQAHEIRKLRRELGEAQEKVHTLTSQLSTNAHVVAAFEQSLTSMTQRLQHLTATSEKKDSELQDLRQAMDALRAQSIQAGIGTGLARQPSSDSVSSLSSACSLDKQEKKKKKGWLRSSFTKAFSRNNAKVAKVAQSSLSEGESSDRQHSPPPPPVPIDQGQEVAELQKQLREKDLVLTDIRLEALSSAHQLESLKDTVMKMRSEMLSLKQNNERLQRMVVGSSNMPTDLTVETRSNSSLDALSDLIPTEEPPPEVESDGKRIAISVYLGQPHSFDRYYTDHYGYDGKGTNNTTEIAVAYTNIGALTSWAQLDNAVRRAFKQYVARLDPGGGLGLGSDSIASYKLGEAERKPDSGPPDLLPVGYAVGRVLTLHVVLQPVAALAFEALIPKGVAQRLVSLLAEHRRLVLCGAPGTGKTHLATRLAEFHAQSLGRDPQEAVATFNVDNKSAKELRQYLQHLSEQAAAGDNSVLPCVVVLDNLHKAGPLADALGSLPRNLPCLLGTMAQSACSATSLQLQHGFRWVLVAPHMEPARGLLGRVLRRRLATLELEQGPQPELAAILGWLPRVWQHLNAFLETHSSGDVAIGPRLFLSCPLELDAARAWFADVWNYSLAPYLREAAREGLQLYGRRAPWTDPAQFILDTYPWPGAPPQGLTTIPAKDVGLETNSNAQAESEGDPLLNMLMRLQEAANYSSPHSNDSDCNSMDSNMTHGSNPGTESVT